MTRLPDILKVLELLENGALGISPVPKKPELTPSTTNYSDYKNHTHDSTCYHDFCGDLQREPCPCPHVHRDLTRAKQLIPVAGHPHALKCVHDLEECEMKQMEGCPCESMH